MVQVIYQAMLRTWKLNAISRPTFDVLGDKMAEIFAKELANPKRGPKISVTIFDFFLENAFSNFFFLEERLEKEND